MEIEAYEDKERTDAEKQNGFQSWTKTKIFVLCNQHQQFHLPDCSWLSWYNHMFI